MPTCRTDCWREPKVYGPPLVSWGVNDRGTYSGNRADPRHGTGSHPRQRWQNAVEGVLDPQVADSAWQGTHVARQVKCDGQPETTHVNRGPQRSYDHILTDPAQLPAVAVGYDHAVREGSGGLSDHSIVTATIVMPAS